MGDRWQDVHMSMHMHMHMCISVRTRAVIRGRAPCRKHYGWALPVTRRVKKRGLFEKSHPQCYGKPIVK